MKRILICLVVGALSLAAQTQSKPRVVTEDVIVHAGPGIPPPGAAVIFEKMLLAAVKGAPFSAESITESVQTLGDGNRITHKQGGKTYRDSEGRTRTENDLTAIGPWSAGEGVTIISIHDPVTKQHITLDTKNKTATKIKFPEAGGTAQMTYVHSESTAPGQHTEIRVEREFGTKETVKETTKAKEKDKEVIVMSGQGQISWTSSASHSHSSGSPAASPEVRKENLGKQTMEGVEVEGTRETRTIPAGAVGNERVIEIVTETWHSPALQTEILRTHSDPRFGATTFRLTAIQRAEPAKSLFEIPADYKVEEPKHTGVRTIKRVTEGPKKNSKDEIF